MINGKLILLILLIVACICFGNILPFITNKRFKNCGSLTETFNSGLLYGIIETILFFVILTLTVAIIHIK